MHSDIIPGQKTILFVEDDAMTAAIYEEILQGIGYNFLHTDTGEKAIKLLLEDNTIDLILIDLDLGDGIDGTETAKRILEKRQIPIVFLTSHTEQAYVDKVRKITRYGFVTKDSGKFVLQSSIELAFQLFEANKAATMSEAKFRSLVETAQELIWKCDEKGIFTYLNPAWERTHGYCLDEMIGRSFGDFQRPEVFERDLKEFSRHLGGGFVKEYETTHIAKDGREIKLLFNAIPLFDSQGKIKGTQGTATDITERKKAENEILKSKNFSESIISSLPGIFYVINQNGNFLQVNERFSKVTLFTQDEILKKLPQDFFSENEKEKVTSKIQEVFKSGESSVEAYLVRKDGVRIPYFFTGFRTWIDNSAILVGVGIDISERIKLEEELKVIRERYDLAVKASSIGIWDWDLRTGIGYASNEWFGLLDYDPGEVNITPEIWNSWIHPDDLNIVNEKITRHFQFKEPYVVEFRMKTKSGNFKWFIVKGNAILDEQGTPIRMTGSTVDITERKKSQEILREKEAQFRTLFEKASEGIIYLSPKTEIVAINDAFAKMHGYSLEDIQKLNLRDLEVEDLSNIAPKRFQKMMNGEDLLFDVRHYHKDGHIIDLEVSASMMIMNGENYFVAFHRDITARKQAEEALRNSEEKFRTYIEMSPNGIFITDEKGKYIEVNSASSKVTGYSQDELLSMDIIDITSPDSQEAAAKMFQNLLNTGRSVGELGYIHKNGETRYWVVNAASLSPTRFLAFVYDTTERKKSEEQIQSLLREKEIILKEVHHRIKNNMSTINALLTLQSGQSKEPVVISALNDATSRVQSMMVLYDKLYQSSNFIQASIKDYLSPLIDQIIKNFPAAIPITVKKNISDFVIDGKKLSSLGIIINELLTNAMKYAFLGRRDGFILVEAYLKPYSSGKAEKVVLTIQDNGNSIPESIDFKNSTGFGLNLIGMMTKQMQGTLLIERNQGTKITLEFEK